MVKEIWKDIKDFEGLYQVSSLGRVKFVLNNKIRKPYNQDRYSSINFRKNTINKTYRIHRLVAEAFIDNPENKKTVNHINGDKFDNNVKNLEWATYKENQNHAIRIKLFNPATRSRKVRCIETGKIYNSIREAARYINLSPAGISKCCTKTPYKGYIGKTSGGYHWEYATEQSESLMIK